MNHLNDDAFTDEDLRMMRRERALQSHTRRLENARSRQDGDRAPNAALGAPSVDEDSSPGDIAYWREVERQERAKRNREEGNTGNHIPNYQQWFSEEDWGRIRKSKERHAERVKTEREAGTMPPAFTDADVKAQRQWSRDNGLDGNEMISYAQYQAELAMRLAGENIRGGDPSQTPGLRG